MNLPDAANPILGPNRLKIATFGSNVECGIALTSAPERLRADWPTTLELAVQADRAGFDAIIPVARWVGFGPGSYYARETLETYTWAAALAASTSHAALVSTSHVTLNQPVVAAKQGATIDHISGGRFALNVVCGWHEGESRMFGLEHLEHDRRYDYASEWLKIADGLWRHDGEFDFTGDFFNLRELQISPGALQSHVPVINAGFSPTGTRWAAKHADVLFVPPSDLSIDGVRARVTAAKQLARDEFGREVQVWSPCYVVCRPSEHEAREYVDYYANERMDTVSVDMLMGGGGSVADHAGAEAHRARVWLAAGLASYPLVGTPEQVVDTMIALSAAGVDGCTLSWLDFSVELPQFISDVLPLMEQADLRRPFVPAAVA
jgi:alkanesulfonate monooxygenase SsuD/methylene tetrahydromethanopterin reductase-like flavin-dependent oxidoreductase (luciferase family)